MFNQVKYYMKNAAVAWQDSFGREIILDKSNLIQAMKNIAKNRTEYKTDQAFQRQLKIYDDARKFAGWELSEP